jgi:hypothetical protein
MYGRCFNADAFTPQNASISWKGGAPMELDRSAVLVLLLMTAALLANISPCFFNDIGLGVLDAVLAMRDPSVPGCPRLLP